MSRIETIDAHSGAILFKRDKDSKDLESALKRLDALEKENKSLKKRVKALEDANKTS